VSHNDTSPLAPGYRLDRYELLGPLAEGGMASVWIARQRGKHGFEKLVAIKTILPQYAADDRFRQMFLDEARIASRIEHFNVARIIDLGEEHDVLYLVMEYVDGDSLSKLRRASSKTGGSLPPGVLLRILADACSGLHEAHELKGEDGQLLDIVHRDISPHNILVSTKGVAKVIDFGIAKARDRMAGETNAGVLKGKIQYMAPEQALGRKVDRRADLWAVGATLYHLLTGKPPYDADNTLGTLHLLTSGRPPLPLPPSVPPAVAAIARKALTGAPEARFQTAAQMRDAMEAAMIDAKVPATTADVGAFLSQQLSDRTAKRRQIIDIALAAAAERQRIEDVLRPQIERTGSGLTNPSPSSGRTIAEAPAALRASGTPGAPASSSPNPSLPGTPAGTASEVIDLPRAPRTGLVAALVAIGLAAAAGVAFVTLRQPSASAHTSPPLPSVPAAPATSSAPPSSTSTTDPAPSSSIPTFSLSDLPRAAPSTTTAPPSRPTWQPARPPAAPPTPAPAKKTKVDDGF
jgi:eukaryotic-like serine/threonine-protein kinase